MRILMKDEGLPLSKDQIDIAELLGTRRQTEAERLGYDAGSCNGMSALEHNIGGIAAEIAVARALNLFPDLQSVTLNTEDLTLPSGRTIDVKWNPFDVDLVVSRKKEKRPCDVYLCVYGRQLSALKFGGWALRADLFKPDRLQDLGYGKNCYVIRAVKLCDAFRGVW